jgi:hypothetical protein
MKILKKMKILKQIRRVLQRTARNLRPVWRGQVVELVAVLPIAASAPLPKMADGRRILSYSALTLIVVLASQSL